MIRAKAIFAPLLLMLIGSSGCGGQAQPTPQRGSLVCWSPDLDRWAPSWVTESRMRFDDPAHPPLVFVCHGRSNADSTWTITADPDCLAEFLKQAYPDRPIVLASCNPSGKPLHASGVWYARDIIWLPPDRWNWPKSEERERNPGVGSIEQFVEGSK